MQEDGSRKVVSHFNKHYKGELARVLALQGESVSSLEDAAHIAQEAGMNTELRGSELVLVI